MNKKYSEEFKRGVVEEYLSGKSSEMVATEYGISRTSVNTWVRKYSEECQYTTKGNKKLVGDEAAKTIRELNRALEEKDKEIRFLKKAAAFFAKEID